MWSEGRLLLNPQVILPVYHGRAQFQVDAVERRVQQHPARLGFPLQQWTTCPTQEAENPAVLNDCNLRVQRTLLMLQSLQPLNRLVPLLLQAGEEFFQVRCDG